jgi:YVTN family beta-propeller protein
MDADSRRIVGAFGVPATPTHLAVDRRGIWVGVTREDDAVLLRYDRAGEQRSSLTVREGIGGLVAGAGTIWVIKRSTNKLAQLARGGDRLVDWASLSGEAGSLRYDDGVLWATLPSEDAVVRVEAKTGRTVIGSAGRAPSDSVLADGRLLVSSRNDNTVVVLDPDTLRVADTPIEVPLNPFSLVGDGRSVWVTGLADNTLTRIGYG